MLWVEEARQFGADIQRVQVWYALSEFYLDAQLSTSDVERIARILANSPFSMEELRHIETYEVDPVCSPNLQVANGEWYLFQPEWLLPQCLEKQQANPYVSGKALSFFEKMKSAAVSSHIPAQRVSEIRADQAQKL